MQCGRRSEIGNASVFKLPEHDTWSGDEGNRTCSFCGSLHPDDMFAQIEKGDSVVPTDKDYKVYVGKHQKFYFQHLDFEQRQKFIELYNGNKMNMAEPGYFYVSPYFCTPVL